MPYSDHFRLTDDLVVHLDAALRAIRDPFVESRYTGFLAVSSVTVLELALKTIFQDFSSAKHPVLGSFCLKHFERINGRIGLDLITRDYLPRFGEKYQKRFQKRLLKLERDHMAWHRASVKSSYGNLIVWRNEFAHEGRLPVNASYQEVKKAFECGKIVMNCLATSMVR